MVGKFGGGMLLLDFSGNSLVLDCGQAHVRAPYTVENAHDTFLVRQKITRPDNVSQFTFNHTYLRFAPTGTPDVTMGTSPTLPFLVSADAVRNSFPPGFKPTRPYSVEADRTTFRVSSLKIP